MKLFVSTLTVLSAIIGNPSIAGMTHSADKQTVEQSETVAIENQQTIVEIATSAGSFNTLIAALKAADLVSVLEGEGPFTRVLILWIFTLKTLIHL